MEGVGRIALIGTISYFTLVAFLPRRRWKRLLTEQSVPVESASTGLIRRCDGDDSLV